MKSTTFLLIKGFRVLNKGFSPEQRPIVAQLIRVSDKLLLKANLMAAASKEIPPLFHHKEN